MNAVPHYSQKQRIAIVNDVLQAGWDLDDEQIQDLQVNGTDVDFVTWEAVITAERTPNGPVDICHPDDAWRQGKSSEQALALILEVLGIESEDAA